MSACFRATYTEDGHKKLAKNRRWLDGFVVQHGQEGKLYDEGGTCVAVGKLPAGLALEEGAEVEKGFGACIIIQVDVPCNHGDIHGSGGGSNEQAAPGAAVGPAAVVPAAAAPSKIVGAGRGAAALPQPCATATAHLRPSGPGGRRPTFKAPRLAPTATSVEAAQQPQQHASANAVQSAQPPQQRRQFMAPPAKRPVVPLLVVQQQQSSLLGAGPAANEAVRSDDDILALLMGGAPLGPPAVRPVHQPPPAKRPRVQPQLPPQDVPFAGQPAVEEAAAQPRAPVPAVGRSKWSSFLAGDDEDELILTEPAEGQFGDPGAAAGAAAGADKWPLGAAGVAAPSGAAQQWQHQAWPPAGPAAAPVPAAQRPAWGQAATGGQQRDRWDLDHSPGSAEAPPASFLPIVRPPGAAQTQCPPPQQRQQVRQVQRPPLQPSAQQLAQQQQQQQHPVGPGAGGGGGWKPPAPLGPAAASAAGNRHLGPAGVTQRAPQLPTSGGSWNRLVEGVVQLGWPTAAEAARPARQVAIPDSFASSQQYVQVWSNALLEELNLRIAEVAQGYHTAVARAGQQQQQQQAGPGGRQPGRGFGPGGASAGAKPTGVGQLEACLRQSRVPYYSSCDLFIWRNNMPKKGGGWKGNKRGRRSQNGDEDGGGGEDGEEAAAKPDSIYLILKSGRQKSADYRRDDLWVLSNTPDFRSSFAPGQLADRSRAPWVAVARSLWHGPNQDGKFEIEFLSPRPPGLGRSQPVYAIKGPDASTELGMMELLRSGAAATMPLLPHLLRAPSTGAGTGSRLSLPRLSSAASQEPQQPGSEAADGLEPGSPCYSCSEDDADELAAATAAADGLLESPLMQAERIIKQFKLNEEQAEVVQYVASWCQPSSASGTADGGASKAGRPVSAAAAATQPPPPVCLVHGPFGSGKSTLLVAILRFILEQRQRQGSPLAGARVLVAAHTNVAVDRVLLGLLESGCTDFLRVGPLRRLSRRLLGQSLHATESRATATAAAELREMLKEASNPADKAVIEAELAAAERGADRQRKRLLKTVPVVGVTCCSSMLAALDGQNFQIVILDECSQMIEPLSAIPLLRAKARFLIAAGDPLQLPPVVASPAHLTASTAGPRAQQQQQQQQQQRRQGGQLHGLVRPLFVRLSALGLPPFLLRRQYRCHPDISAVPNAQFYGGRLVDGCTREQRASLLPGLPSLAFLDVRGQEQYSAGRSASNQAEAEAVVAAVELLVASGVSLGQCGVICFFRAQVALVRSLLDRRLPQLQHHQQQRQQAAALAGDRSSHEAEEALGVAAGGSAGSGEGEESAGDQAAQQNVQVATVDSFQGAECDVIILTTAVTRPGAFASDSCRLNVALTRARHNLIIVGCAPALQQSAPAFAALLSRCRATPGGYFPGRLPALGLLASAQQQDGRQVQRQGVLAGAGGPALAAVQQQQQQEKQQQQQQGQQPAWGLQATAPAIVSTACVEEEDTVEEDWSVADEMEGTGNTCQQGTLDSAPAATAAVAGAFQAPTAGLVGEGVDPTAEQGEAAEDSWGQE